MPNSYYASKISEHIFRTPEGYLICRDVPINRVGTYDYAGSEIGLTGADANKIFHVLRRPEEVFSPAALASFEGKPITDNHPDEDVGPENRQYYNKGHAHNVRKGTGKWESYTIADLQIEDPQLIKDVEDAENGKREISCGYDFDLFQNPNGIYEQKKLVGNHIAIVPEGRAGSSVAIQDSKTERSTNMSTPAEKSKTGFWGGIFRAAAKDASVSDEDLEKAVMEVGAKGKDEEIVQPNPLPEIKDPKTAPAKDESPAAPVSSELHELLELLKAFMARETPKEAADDDLQNLIDPKPTEKPAAVKEDEEEGPEESEQSVVVDPEDVEEYDHAAARDAAAKAAKIIQTELAALYKDDPAAYKAHAKDAAAKLNQAFGLTKPADTGYGKFVQSAKSSQAAKVAHDSIDDAERAIAEAQSAYDALNPHNKKEAK